MGVASYWKTIALTASILMFVFLVLGIIASVVAVNQRKAINAQKDWSNTEARSDMAGFLKHREHLLEDAKEDAKAEKYTGAKDDKVAKAAWQKTKDEAVKDAERNIEKTKEWIRCFDEDSTTREAKVTYCERKEATKTLEFALEDAKADAAENAKSP